MSKWEAWFIFCANWRLDERMYLPSFLIRVPIAEDKDLILRDLRVTASPRNRVEEIANAGVMGLIPDPEKSHVAGSN